MNISIFLITGISRLLGCALFLHLIPLKSECILQSSHVTFDWRCVYFSIGTKTLTFLTIDAI